jgi:thiol-disulfide isomerase/thioredoxin
MLKSRQFRGRILSTTASIAVIVASTLVAVNTSLDLRARWRQPKAPAASRPAQAARSFQPGMHAPSVRGVDNASADRTLVLFVSTHCGYCEKSVPFYKELSARLSEGAAGRKRRLVAVFPQDAGEVSQYKAAKGLEIEAVAGAVLGELGVSGTPTMLLVSREGVVLRAWMGAPPQETQRAITAAFLAG